VKTEAERTSGPTAWEPEAVRTLNRHRTSMVSSLGVIALCLSAAIALMLGAFRKDLSQIAGIDYRVLQVALFGLVLAFVAYTYERETRLRRTTQDLMLERADAARLSSELAYLRRIETDRDTIAALLIASADGILVVNPDTETLRMNPALEELTGHREHESHAVQCAEIFGCHRGGDRLTCGSVCPFRRVIMSGAPLRDHSFQATRDDGSTFWVSGAYAPVRDPDGRIAFAIGSLRDFTRSKEVEQLQHDFVSIVSHELRGPLTAIKGFVKTLIAKGDTLPRETGQEFLETINEQADRLNQLVEDLLNVSHIESRRLKIKLEHVDLASITERLVKQFRTKWGSRDIKIEAEPELPNVRADQSKIEEVLVNLIDNAVKYSPQGGRVRVAMASQNGEVEVSVEDSGIGITPEDSARLFEKFHRVASPETRDIGGSGLGLYIVKNLVEAHGGRVLVTSAPGVGSTFTFSLPRNGPSKKEIEA
jgi:signal transduction histidine kinase